MLLVLNYGVFNELSETATKRLSLGALLHDIGLTGIPKQIAEADRKLTDQEFREYKKHVELGHKMIRESIQIDLSVAKGVLEHHERLDGKGYPKGISDVSFEGRLIGIADCFEDLINTEKKHRKRREPFEALKIVQDEILREGKFDKDIFKNFCLSLLGKTRYS